MYPALGRRNSSNFLVPLLSFRDSVECMFDIADPTIDEGWEPSAAELAAVRAVEDEFDVVEDCVSDEVTADSSFDVAPGAFAALMFEGTDPESLSSYDLLDAATSLGRLASWAQAKQAKMLAAFAYRRPPSGLHDDGFQQSADISRYAVEEISCALSLTRRGAENRLGLALQLTTSLPGTLAAWERGDLDWPKVNLIADRTGILDRDGARRVEESVLPRAEHLTTGQLRRIVDRAVITADPAAANTRHDQERLDRDVTIRPATDGMAVFSAYLSAEEAAAAKRVLDTLSKDPGADDPRSAGQRRADTFMQLITGHTLTGEVTISTPVNNLTGAGKPLVHLIIGADTLSGQSDTPAELVGYGPIPSDLARRLAADGMWQRILTDPATGDIREVSQTRYRPPAALQDYVRARDQVCTFPTCRQPATDCDLDHTIPHNKHGPTSDTNLTAKCRRHHLLKHHTGWLTTQHHDGSVTWISPAGHKYVNRPETYADYLESPTPAKEPPPAPTWNLPDDPPF